MCDKIVTLDVILQVRIPLFETNEMPVFHFSTVRICVKCNTHNNENKCVKFYKEGEQMACISSM